MKILFLYPDMITRSESWHGYYYEGIAMLSAAAKQAGHETALLHVYKPLDDAEILRWVEENRDGDNTLLAFSATTNQFPHVKRWAPMLKSATGLPTVIGGMHPTLSAEDAMAADGVDMICCGDGEGPLAELATRLQAGGGAAGVKGLWYRDGGGIVRQELAPNTDVSTAPYPDWGIYPEYHKLEAIRERVGILMGSRGCPYNCAYCCNLALIKQSKGRGRYLRFKEVDEFIKEIEVYLARYPETVALFFEDDIFGVWKKWLREFVPAYKKEIGMPFGCNMRPNLVDQEMVDLLAEAGCKRVHMAIESGNEEVRNRILNRNLSHDVLVGAFKMFKNAGIQLQSYNIVGSPHETPRAVLDTIKMNAEIDPEWIQHSIFYPYEGTPLYELVHKEGLVARDREVTDYFADTVLEQATIRREQVVMFQEYFKPLVKHYQRIWAWPKPLRGVAQVATDRFLVWRGAPRTMRAVRQVGGALPRWGRRPAPADKPAEAEVVC